MTEQTKTTKAGRRETRSFRLNEHEVLKDIITRQAGTLTKALLEAVMNAADAGATVIDVRLTARHASVRDNGRGFASRQEIETNFEVFGQEQTEEERGRKLYGEFRMGRGQIFHFGVNRWRTNTFAMEVDVQKCLAEKTGFQYDLIEELDDEPGCAIAVDLYRPLAPRDISRTTKELQTRVRYVPAEILINGRKATVDPETEKWTAVTGDAYIRLSEHGHTLEVFNRGIFVEDFQRRTYGAAGVIVSKKRLTVNFARNEIISTCPVWRRISEHFDHQAEKRIKKKFALDEEERANAIARLVSGEMDAREVWQMQIFLDAVGHPWSPAAIHRAAFPQFTTAFKGDSRADTLIQTGLCLVLDQETVDLFELDSPGEIFKKFNFLRGHLPPAYVPYDEVAAELSDECLPVPKHRWTPTERIWLEFLSSVARNLLANNASYKDDEKRWRKAADLVEHPKRVLRIGSSRVCNAWTDGATYIFLAREWLEYLEFVKHDLPYHRDLLAAAQTLTAQFCFSDDSRSGGHTPDFYKTYYELTKLLPSAIAEASGILSPTKLDQLKKRVAEEARADQRSATSRGTSGSGEAAGGGEKEWPDVLGESEDGGGD